LRTQNRAYHQSATILLPSLNFHILRRISIMPPQNTQTARQPLLEGSDYHYEDVPFDGIVPPDPFAGLHHESTIVVHNQQDYNEEELQDDDDKAVPPTHCIEKLGLFIGLIIGVTVQLSTLAGNFVNVTVWGTEDGPYAMTTFIVWCCFMSSMFFVSFGLLRCLVQMSLQMVYKMEQDKASMVVDVPSDNPLPNPAGFSSMNSSSGHDSFSTISTQDELLEDVMWHMRLHYVLGINLGISFSWIATNVALGNQRVSLVFALAPPLLGLALFWWMKRSRTSHDDGVTTRRPQDFDPLPTISEEFAIL